MAVSGIAVERYDHDRHYDGVGAVWAACFPDNPPWNAPERAIPKKLAEQPELFWVALDEGGAVVGTTMAGYDGHRGWIYYVAVLPERRGTGITRALMAAAEAALAARGCVKINIQVRGDNAGVVGLYEKLGYAVEDRISVGKRVG